MMKKIFSLILSICLVCGAGIAAAEGSAETPITAGELTEWSSEIKTMALGSIPMNDPTDPEDAESEDGNLFDYPFASIYADATEMTEETEILSIDLKENGAAALRGLTIGMAASDLIRAFPNDNPGMAGDRSGAILYLRDGAMGETLYGQVLRDGQRISRVEYGEIAEADGGYRRTALVCFFHEGLLYELRAEGLGQKANLDAESREEIIRQLQAMAGKDEYLAFASSTDGSEIAPFGEEDLVFSGIDFLRILPDELPGNPEKAMIDNGDGSWLMIVNEEGYNAVFYTDSEGNSPLIASLEITDDRIEGPRGVRLGDMLNEVYQRFCFERVGMDAPKSMLYGNEEELPRGSIENEAEGVTLRYLTEVTGGRVAELILRFHLNELSEIIIQID